MILGKTNKQRYADYKLKSLSYLAGIKKFAWLPKKLKNGCYVWFQIYYLYHTGFYDHHKIIWHVDKDGYGKPEVSLFLDKITDFSANGPFGYSTDNAKILEEETKNDN